jgi:Leucine-rich repeat (LRR) protein
MKTSFLFILLIVLTISCKLTDQKKQDKIARQNNIDTTFTVDPSLNKLSTDTFKIDRASLLAKYPFYFFKDNQGFCKLENDTIKIFLKEGRLTSTVLNLSVSKKSFGTDIWIYDCMSNTQYKAISQGLKLNAQAFEVGDTIIGYLDFTGLPYYKDKYIGSDTLTARGKFKFLIRPFTFTNDDLEKENNFNDFVALTKNRPDTIKEVDLRKSGLTEIPKEILLFKNLESISLEDNNLRKADFSVLKQLTKLKKLKLQECRLTEIPSVVFALTNLEEFDIYLNNISNIPDELFDLKNLKALQIGGNNLKTLSPSISKLTKLEWIEFSSTQIFKLPDAMTKIKSLKEIYPNDTMIYIPNKLKHLLASSCDYVTSR